MANSSIPVPPDDDRTPIDGWHKLAARVLELETKVGDHGQGLISDVRHQLGALAEVHVLLVRIDERLTRMEANRVADLVDAQVRHEEARAEADERCERIAKLLMRSGFDPDEEAAWRGAVWEYAVKTRLITVACAVATVAAVFVARGCL